LYNQIDWQLQAKGKCQEFWPWELQPERVIVHSAAGISYYAADKDKVSQISLAMLLDF
jgi:hypothetical protein